MNVPPPSLVAIHQPNLLPWLGYFDKMRRADIFIHMDNAQFPKTGAGTWTNRVQLLVGRRAAYVTVPVVRAYHGYRSIAEMQISEDQDWRTKLLRLLELEYRRAPFFDATMELLRPLVSNPTSQLAEYNLHANRAIAEAIGISTPTVLGSTLDAGGRATELLISMVAAVGGTAYLAGGGSSGYQDDSLFATHGIELMYQEFQHPVYPQAGASVFTQGLSIVDALMNRGTTGVRELLG